MVDIKLAKVRKVVFNRTDDNVFYVTLETEDGETVFTGEPRIIDEWETYIVNFNHDIVVGIPDYDSMMEA